MGDDISVVDGAVLAEAAVRGAIKMKTFEQTLDELGSDMNAILENWKSPAAERYQIHFAAHMYAISELFEQYKHYPERLKQIVADYDQAENVAVNIATEIEAPIWAEV